MTEFLNVPSMPPPVALLEAQKNMLKEIRKYFEVKESIFQQGCWLVPFTISALIAFA